jgi:hypothetical protein
MHGQPTARQLPRFAEREIGVRKGKAFEGAGKVVDKVIPAIMKLNADTDAAQDFQIAIEPANRQAKLTRENEASLRPFAQQFEHAKEALGTLDRYGEGGGLFGGHNSFASASRGRERTPPALSTIPT